MRKIFLGLALLVIIYGILTFDFSNPESYYIEEGVEYFPEYERIDLPEYSGSPSPELTSSDLWKKVSDNRYECDFLKLAIEWYGGDYLLVEMEGDERIIAKSRDYSKIQDLVVRLTLKDK